MKLTKVKVYGFGKWVDKEFDFNSDYQVIFGPNEAGKTTLLTFIKSVLFGFASARGDDKYQQYKPRKSNSYGGELIFTDTDGTIWTIRRVDGQFGGELTLFRDDQQVPETLLADKITGGFTKEDFENTHVLDANNILSIYKLNEEQLETEILTVGTVGSKEWLLSAEGFEKLANGIYKPRGRKQELSVQLELHKKLISQKSEFKNQQLAYQQVTNELNTTEEEFSENNQEYQEAQKKSASLQNLSSKWPKYLEYLDLIRRGNEVENPISNQDWEQVIKINQQLAILSQNNYSTGKNQLSDSENRILESYQNNKNDLDYLSAKKNSIRDLQYQKQNSNEQLKNNDSQIDNLIATHTDYKETMKILTDEQLKQLDENHDTKKKSNSNIFVIVLIVIGLILFIASGFLRFVGIVIGLVGLGLGYYQRKVASDSISTNELSFLSEKGYQGMTIDQVKELQPIILQLYSLRNKQNAIENTLNNIQLELDKWKQYLNDFGLLENGSTDYAQSVDDYFSRLQRIKTKSDMITKSNSDLLASQKSNQEKISDLNDQLDSICMNYSTASFEQLEDLHTKQLARQTTSNLVDQHKAIIGDDMDVLQKFTDSNDLNQQLLKSKQELSDLEEVNNRLNRQVGSIKNQREQIFNDDEYQNLISELSQNEANIIELYDEWLADKLSSKWIHRMLNIASENRYPKMLKRASQYFCLLTDDNYVDIKFNVDNKKTLKVIRRDKTKFDVHELSRATTVQLYISLRLAFVTEISNLINLPILIDDAFVDFDKIRTSKMFELVKEVSKVNQIIYVTANMVPDVASDHVTNIKRGN
ncbi:AAA family ATPase [Companilactobacillus allii]|uniref:YhaN AAA domain-containing protein n=1 Tax=Companilactobacillus allii TaxID=1847728 RepID=A0A1P8Q3T5_9LACO|nr:AAA family ATPase [Companilactobacillus allii]APX72516.1 hypothetical protein BTM29_08125 [Companilactobacillus allii]USQ69619.1 AAA family ATPase [Companilactobacillus allii]